MPRRRTTTTTATTATDDAAMARLNNNNNNLQPQLPPIPDPTRAPWFQMLSFYSFEVNDDDDDDVATQLLFTMVPRRMRSQIPF
jgi:hypothetical protein